MTTPCSVVNKRLAEKDAEIAQTVGNKGLKFRVRKLLILVSDRDQYQGIDSVSEIQPFEPISHIPSTQIMQIESTAANPQSNW